MKLKFNEIIPAIPSFQKLTAGNLSLKLAYKLDKFTAELQKEADFYFEQREKIIAKYSEKENSPELKKELNELWNMEISIDGEKLTVHSTEDVKLSLPDMEALKKFINFVE